MKKDTAIEQLIANLEDHKSKLLDESDERLHLMAAYIHEVIIPAVKTYLPTERNDIEEAFLQGVLSDGFLETDEETIIAKKEASDYYNKTYKTHTNGTTKED